MAGNYPDVLGRRMAYDRDGTIVCYVDMTNGGVWQHSQGTVNTLNSDTIASIEQTDFLWSTHTLGYALIFPELRDITGYYFHSGGARIMWSPDSTNGQDGTWIVAVASTPGVSGTSQTMRTAINPLSLTGVKSIRYDRSYGAGGRSYLYNMHFYGHPSSNANRLRLWHPTLDQEVGGAYFDWGNVPRNSSADIIFRLKNTHSISTANDINITFNALTDTTPTTTGQHLLQKESAPGFGASLNLASLGPGAISEVLTLRRVTPANAVLALWTLRLIAHANSWT